ncbi:hypothetical protein EZI54_03380 [Marinobacter halodurans]|uniref:Uncharacterized protein n=1 Tax=Marinobacter halodurans TaxID=2528979 RepID=A0ABY1ZNX0_9GAMM|nr:hypothetical protein [Marinobacter halodurans]TBW58441.1 hypothetical protein EZI54_03380 [Marinobacter halodurans]
MALPSTGAQHYTLLLLPGLLSEIERLGLRQVIARSSLTASDISGLYFEAKTITRLLPDDLESIDPELWPDLVECVRILAMLVREVTREDLARTKRQAINQFLPRARHQVRDEVRRQLGEGNVDFRLAGMTRPRAGGEQAEETCIEAIRLERQRRYRTMMTLDPDLLGHHQAAIVEEARTYVAHQMGNPPEDFGALDLLIHLGDVLRVLLTAEQDGITDEDTAPPGHISVSNVVMGIGNLLYADELGLRGATAPADPGREACP